MQNVDNYINKINSALQGAGSIRVSSFVEDHIRAEPLLHPHATSDKPDMSALIYGLLRVPVEILKAKRIVLGQSDRVFAKAGLNIASKDWADSRAIARTRKCKFNSKTGTLALCIASVTDVEDIVTIVTALYIEFLKLQNALKQNKQDTYFAPKDYQKLQEILGTNFAAFKNLAENPTDWPIQLLAGSLVEYGKAVQEWWINIAKSRKQFPINVYQQPVYFVSSNSHSLINILSGFSHKEKATVFKLNAERLKQNQAEFKKEQVSEENICYYLSRFTEKLSPAYKKSKLAWENKFGLVRLPPFHDIDIEAQIFSIKQVARNSHIDQRLGLTAAKLKQLQKSNALIVNIAYPLGQAAYHILKEVSENISEMRGVYIMGKAASLNAQIGDITIPSVIYDSHASNTIFLKNTCTVESFAKYFPKSSIFTNQKTVCVHGTFLQNEKSLHDNFKQGYSIVEMEAGPYAERLYEMQNPERHPKNETFVLNPTFPVGLAYYVSDTPHNKGVNLGSKRLTWEGLNATYAVSLGILNHIFDAEFGQIKASHGQGA